MFAGFKSRWTTPFWCAASSAAAIWRAICECVGKRQSGLPLRAKAFGQCDAVNQLHHERAQRRFGRGSRTSTPLNAMHGRDVRMVQ